jgi:hypothetical protein
METGGRTSGSMSLFLWTLVTSKCRRSPRSHECMLSRGAQTLVYDFSAV